ncbi:SDR family oxidoreductase [Nocardia speluncae]|uniref:SDR family oxidoreductase n=1 Tax=Nocardia speluncae TaxID=419477 RepID=A0A846XCD7_9NOCA|nr:SDR family oxidoreductase [Nocardia speluncae]NKY32440.1 SDR family oxidoreductase [Nocardia speluncae]
MKSKESDIERPTGTALVTGASSGIGAEFAAALAVRGHDLVLVARSAARLESLAAELRGRHGVEVEVVVQDLAEPGAAERVVTELAARGLSVDVLVNNAGFGSAGRYEDIAAETDHGQLMVNVVALEGLTHRLVPAMVARGRGEVINIASTAALQPAPYFATYAAGKAFVLNFSLALWSEYRDRGIKVLAVCPGPTETGFFEVVGTRDAAVTGSMGTAAEVVQASLRALARNKGYIVPGRQNFAAAHLMPRRPRTLVARIAKRVTAAVAEAAGKHAHQETPARPVRPAV